jgi:hypothetical protein
MTWELVKQLIRQSGLKHSILNKGGECETVSVERYEAGSGTSCAHLYRYEPQYWQRHLHRMGIAIPKQFDLFEQTNP